MAATPHDRHSTVSFEVEAVGPVLRVAFCGELDLACAELFDGLFDLDTTGIRSVVLDLGRLTFCDVTGLNALDGLKSFHECHGRAVEYVDVLRQTRRLMAVMDLPPFFFRARRSPGLAGA